MSHPSTDSGSGASPDMCCRRLAGSPDTKRSTDCISTALPKPAAGPRPNRVRRWLLRLLRIVAIIYLVLVLLVSMFQEHLIFPGAYMSVPPGIARVPVNSESFRLDLPDGIQVSGLFLPARATASSAERSPTILYFYGNGSSLAVSAAELDLFRSCGANVLSIDYPGYRPSTGEPSEANCYAAASALWDYALTRPEVDPDQIIIVGWSLGGAIALDLAHKHPSAPSPRGLMLISSFTSLDEMARLWMPFLPTGLLLRHHFTNITKIPDIHCPIIIAHGENDPMIPYAMSLRLRDAATGSASVQQFPIRGAEHNDVFDVGSRQIALALTNLINTLQRPASAITPPESGDK
jgi:uncharacterized protein